MNKQNLINMRADDISRTLVNLTRDIRRNRELPFEPGLDEELNDIETLTENIKELYEKIEALEKAKQRDNLYMCQAYYGQSEDNISRAYTYKDMYNEHKLNEEDKLSPEDIDRIIEGYREVIKKFDKRLKTYLKRYGLSKVKAWSYLSD